MRRNKNKRVLKKKVILILIVLIILISMGVYVYFNFFKGNSKVEEKTKVVDSIKKYGYTVSDNDTKLFKTKFKELKRLLNKDKIDNKKYSELVAELFIIDFFSLDNKITKNDIGGVQFVYDNYKTSFIDKARDEFYKYVKNNLNDDRTQELPVISTIKVKSSEKVSLDNVFKKDELKNIEEAYKIELSWTYQKDLGYQKEATLIVVKDGDLKFSVAKLYNDTSSESSDD